MRKERLLERVRYWSSHNEPHNKAEATTSLRESIRSHLENILTTRQGNALIDEQYGFSQKAELFEEFVMANQDELIAALTETVLYYEPRISKLDITNVEINPYSQQICCKMTGQLNASYEEDGFSFTTIISTHGKVTVRL
ncbi:type VI secretion system baseplate subunit TssE [Legionella spiritensis]|uniref:IraD/Gp25-like domain-containing protein n=1 Tax=Legionella spiritensis TaxID=452 RepID=A0A0W0Z9F8_LEGSP|nr:type VI secretion system baseplate subunit TssE [Legionella spiritensis]KTD65740.1 hypothetical protein Lspi_0452 [Legionella spiritensis]SNV42789.1 type VI secretion system lysozyme-like protein [Legionella spiritensis]VEG90603.1 type VI secretion system lysozyme-like protein [Legionella spiritensis]